MSKIKEQDILKLLRGKASAKKLKALEEWSRKDPDNAMELEYYQRVYDESDHLNTYKKVDADLEWAQFNKKLQVSVTDSELLEYFDGFASPKQRKKVEEWKSYSEVNDDEFKAFNLILSESQHLSEYKNVDVDAEWKSFNKAIKEKVAPANLATKTNVPVAKETLVTPGISKQESRTIPTIPLTQKPTATSSPSTDYQSREVPFTPVQRKEPSIFQRLIIPLSIAACFLLFTWGGYAIYQNVSGAQSEDDLYLTFATAETPDVLTISDGSVLSLDERTTVRYFKDVDLINRRSITIDGGGEFDVASNPQKPFVVQASRSGVGIRVLGTKFRLEKSDEYIEVIENIEGSVRAYSLADTNTYVVMTAGDKYGFDGVKFVDLNDIKEEYNGQQYDVLYVLDYLMEQSDWRVTSSPYAEFTGDAFITVDLNKPYEEILEDLSEREDFEYVKLECEGCYQVTRFTASQ